MKKYLLANIILYATILLCDSFWRIRWEIGKSWAVLTINSAISKWCQSSLQRRTILEHNSVETLLEYTSKTIVGAMDDNGLFPGLIKFDGAGGGRPAETFIGMEKSPISLFRSIPVLGDSMWEPKYEFTVLVMETAFRSRSMMDIWLVPWSWIWFHLLGNKIQYK